MVNEWSGGDRPIAPSAGRPPPLARQAIAHGPPQRWRSSPRHAANRDAGEGTGSWTDAAIRVGLIPPDALVGLQRLDLLHEAGRVEPGGHDLLPHVLEAQPSEDALAAVDELRDLAQNLGVDEGHQEKVAVILMDIVVEHPDVIVAELQLCPFHARVHHERQIAEALVQLFQVLGGPLRWEFHLASKDPVRLLRKLPGGADTRVLGLCLLATAEVVPTHALLVAGLRLPEQDLDLAALEAAAGHDARPLERALLAHRGHAVLLRQGTLRVHRGDPTEREAIHLPAQRQGSRVLHLVVAVQGHGVRGDEARAPLRRRPRCLCHGEGAPAAAPPGPSAQQQRGGEGP
mmetsp:Transcript_74704/g.211346  ORF Transcript_74704/g.211346 Transcript_74704/m.211346 type:complete len:345 (-) Transcript_74704:18-1052(-)